MLTAKSGGVPGKQVLGVEGLIDLEAPPRDTRARRRRPENGPRPATQIIGGVGVAIRELASGIKPLDDLERLFKPLQGRNDFPKPIELEPGPVEVVRVPLKLLALREVSRCGSSSPTGQSQDDHKQQTLDPGDPRESPQRGFRTRLPDHGLAPGEVATKAPRGSEFLFGLLRGGRDRPALDRVECRRL